MRSREEIEQGLETNLTTLKQALSNLRDQITQIDQALADGEFRGIQILPAARAIQQAILNLQKLDREAEELEKRTMMGNDEIIVDMETYVVDINELD